MSNPTLVAQTRSEFGKGAARRARRAGLVPGVLYGHGDAPLHVDLPGHELFLAVRGQKNALVELVIEGKKHLDVEVPVSIIGEPAPGTQHTQEEFALLVKAPATSIPESIEVDITGVEAGTAVRVADVTFPKGVISELDPETVVVTVSEEVVEEEEEAAPAEEAAESAE